MRILESFIYEKTVRYGFTWSAIVDDAVEKGLYTKQRSGGQIIAENHMAKKPEMFVVKDMPVNVKKVNRSVQLDRDIYDRLKKLEQEKGQYTHSSILNQLLDDALVMYGY